MDQHKSVKVLSGVIGASTVVVMGAVAVAVASEQAGTDTVRSAPEATATTTTPPTAPVTSVAHRGDDCKHTRGIPLTPSRGNS